MGLYCDRTCPDTPHGYGGIYGDEYDEFELSDIPVTEGVTSKVQFVAVGDFSQYDINTPYVIVLGDIQIVFTVTQPELTTTYGGVLNTATLTNNIVELGPVQSPMAPGSPPPEVHPPIAREQIHKAYLDFLDCVKSNGWREGMGMAEAANNAYRDQSGKFMPVPLPSTEPPDPNMSGPSALDYASGALEGSLNAMTTCRDAFPLSVLDPSNHMIGATLGTGPWYAPPWTSK